MTCASCGAANDAANRFCDTCGQPLTSACPSCGEAVRAGARFCGNCGHAMGTDAPPATRPLPGERPREGMSAATAERRLVSVLFTDLVGFTSLAEDRDPETVRELLSRYFDTATEIVQLHGGTVEKFIGDAVMAVWGTPVAHEDDAERAVRAALQLIDAVGALHPDLRARAGVLTGEAAVTIGAQNQGMVAGDLVNTAARLQGVAEPGSVLVGEATMRAAERAVVFEPLGDHALRGKTTPVPAWRAVRVVANRGGQGRGDTLEPPFVGRSEELRQLKEVLHAVGREAKTRLVSITGPGGIGKSRLVWELEKYVDGVAEDIWWHRGRSPSYGEGITFWALGEMVRRRAGLTEDDDEAATRAAIAAALTEYVPDPDEHERIGHALLTLLGVEPPPPGGRDALFPTWRLFLERIAERGTTVLVFEDLHWADSGLLDFIDHLLEWCRGLPIVVVTLARPELFDRRPDWGAGRRQLTALSLEPLTDAAMTELLDGLVPGLPRDAVAAIVARAEGVPLYAVETVRGLLADGRIERRGDAYAPVGDLGQISVPDSLRSLIASRLDVLDPADRSLLQDAAVLGQVFSTEALAAVNGAEAGDVEQRLRGLARRELLDVERDLASPERGQYKFVQSLIREVAYGTLARRDRRARHLAVARHYETIGDDELAGALANHYLAAREASDEGPETDALTAQARLALAGAADRAASLGAYDQAVRYLTQALEITAEPRERASLLDRAAAAASAAATEEAQRFAEEATRIHEELGDRVALAHALMRLGRVLIDASELDRSRDALERALAEAEASEDEEAIAAATAYLSRAYMRLVRPDDATAVADRSLLIAERRNLEPLVAEAMLNKASALAMVGRRRESVALHALALDLIVRLGLRSDEMRARNNLAAAMNDDDPAAATRMLLEGIELARNVGDRAMYNWMIGTAAPGLLLEGRDWERHSAVMREALEAATLPRDRMRLGILLSLLETPRGVDPAPMIEEVERLVGESTDVEAGFSVHMAHAEAGVASGAYRSAFEHARKAAALRGQNYEIAADLMLHAAARLRDPDLVREAAAVVRGTPGAGNFSQVSRAHAGATVAAVEGRTAEAVAALRQERAVFHDMGLRYAATTLAMDALYLLPDEPEVRAWAEEDRPLLESLGAVAILRQLDAGLALGSAAPTPRATTSAPAPVDPSAVPGS